MESRSDSLLKPLFQNLGIVKDDELLLSKFKYSKKSDTSIIGISGKKISFHLIRDTIKHPNDRIITFYDTDSSEARINFHQGIKYAFLDIIFGGNRELVVLIEHYLMNTEIYTFEVFEIKTKD